MGTVYQARQARLNRMVAVKILNCPSQHRADFSLRFEREAQVLARLNHPNIITLFDFGEIDRSSAGREALYYFLMEYVDGPDLGKVIRDGGLEPDEALALVPQICEALQFAHDEGITHRDIKPANILVDRKGRVKIADFGIAKLVSGDETLAMGLTMTGATMGTPQYMAPEQWETSGKADHRVDIYSLGVVIYELLTGERPGGVFDPPSKRCRIDRRLDAVVMRAMEKEPDRRYQQASEVSREVTRVIGRVPDWKCFPSRRWKWMAGAGAVLVAGLGLGMWMGETGKESGDGASHQGNLNVPEVAPGRLRAAGSMAGGVSHDLSKFAGYGDFVDVAGGRTRWVALRSNGETVSSDGSCDFTEIRRIATGYHDQFALISTNGEIRFPVAAEMALPAGMEGEFFTDVAYGARHGVALTREGRAVVFGLRYEEATEGDSGSPSGYDSPRWSPPPPEVLTEVKDLAATSTHAATLHRDGRLSIWSSQGVVALKSGHQVGPIRQVEASEDHFWILEEKGRVWQLAVPRNPSPDQPIYGPYQFVPKGAGSSGIGSRCWLKENGRWGAEDSIGERLFLENEIGANDRFALTCGIFKGKSFASLLWIDTGGD